MAFRMTRLLPILAALAGGCYVPPGPVKTDSPWYWQDPVTQRGFYLYVPENYTTDRAWPVIVSCHGTPPFDIAAHHIDTWKGYGEKYGCIVVAPSLDGTDGILGDGPILGMMNNERSILSILSMLSYQYNVDRANIMITGFSGGGFPAYWVGLRNPDVFSVVIAQNCNFSRSNLDGWWPPAATQTPVMVFWGENDPATIVSQSRQAVEYLRAREFNVHTAIIPGAGHDRHPEVAMAFFRRHMKPPIPTMQTGAHTPRPVRPSYSETQP